mgnify:CR=1 FL=1|jgi:DNA-binding MarR family transcriptional regulator
MNLKPPEFLNEYEEMTTKSIDIANKQLALETLKLFRIIFKSTNRHFHEIEKAVGIGGASLWAISEIAENSEITITDLAKSMSIHQTTASNLVDKLERSGYVQRIRSTIDRRVVNIKLTEFGRSILKNAPAPYRGILPDALIKMETEQLSLLKNNLSSLISSMDIKELNAAFETLGND